VTDELIELIPDSSYESINNEDLLLLLQQLDPLSKKIIYLKYYCNYTQSEIAKILDTTQSTISRLEKKALEKMKSLSN